MVLDASEAYRALDESAREAAMKATADDEIIFPLLQKLRRR
jgi:hypothetical protein